MCHKKFYTLETENQCFKLFNRPQNNVPGLRNNGMGTINIRHQTNAFFAPEISIFLWVNVLFLGPKIYFSTAQKIFSMAQKLFVWPMDPISILLAPNIYFSVHL